MSSSGAYRLAQGGQLDRSRSLSFTFNGRLLSGHAGDTLASALLANGISVVARSFKYHRPRGIFSAGFEEPNALLRVEINGAAVPLVRATMQPLVEGMVVTSENCFPSVDFDLARIFDHAHALLPAGFYNKTFKWPGWHTYESAIRRMAGLGTLPTGEDKTAFFRHNLRCDVLVVGAGIAGLSAALEASRAGARVTLIEQDAELGGRALCERTPIDGRSSQSWIGEVVGELTASSQVTILRRTLVAGYYDHNVLTALDLSDNEHPTGSVQRFWTIRASEVILATGAIERRSCLLTTIACCMLERTYRYVCGRGRQHPPDRSGLGNTFMAVAVDRMGELQHSAGGVANQRMADVFRGLQAPLRAFLMQQCRSRDDAEDLVQEIFLRLWRKGAPLEIRSFKAFAFKMAWNLVKDRSRRAHTRMMSSTAPPEELQFSDMGEGEPSGMVESIQMLGLVAETLAKLRPSTREAFLLYRMEECPRTEIAAHMGISVSMVEKHVSQATAAALRNAGVQCPVR